MDQILVYLEPGFRVITGAFQHLEDYPCNKRGIGAWPQQGGSRTVERRTSLASRGRAFRVGTQPAETNRFRGIGWAAAGTNEARHLHHVARLHTHLASGPSHAHDRFLY
jgi:hypothetical protein